MTQTISPPAPRRSARVPRRVEDRFEKRVGDAAGKLWNATIADDTYDDGFPRDPEETVETLKLLMAIPAARDKERNHSEFKNRLAHLCMELVVQAYAVARCQDGVDALTAGADNAAGFTQHQKAADAALSEYADNIFATKQSGRRNPETKPLRKRA